MKAASEELLIANLNIKARECSFVKQYKLWKGSAKRHERRCKLPHVSKHIKLQ